MEKLTNPRPCNPKSKLIIAIQLFEQYVDAPIKSITIVSSTSYLINTGEFPDYVVDISTNVVSKMYPDPDYS